MFTMAAALGAFVGALATGLFTPISTGRLWVAPADWAAPVPEGMVGVRLSADDHTFLVTIGGRLHPTTYGLLDWLEGLPAEGRAELLDYGCGSGVLGISALRLGVAAHATLADVSESAVACTASNAALNGVDNACRVHTRLSSEVAPDSHRVDICVANMLPGPLVSVALDLASRVRTDGMVALSGFKVDSLDAVRAVLGLYVRFEEPLDVADGWLRLAGRRTAVAVGTDVLSDAAVA